MDMRRTAKFVSMVGCEAGYKWVVRSWSDREKQSPLEDETTSGEVAYQKPRTKNKHMLLLFMSRTKYIPQEKSSEFNSKRIPPISLRGRAALVYRLWYRQRLELTCMLTCIRSRSGDHLWGSAARQLEAAKRLETLVQLCGVAFISAWCKATGSCQKFARQGGRGLIQAVMSIFCNKNT